MAKGRGCISGRNKLCVSISVILVIGIVATCVIGFLVKRHISVAEPTLRFVSIVHRHGERAPLRSYPLDPYKGESFWPEGLGVLLQKGKISMYEWGRFLRHRYNLFLSATYKPSEIFVLSTKTDRHIVSGQLTVAGLYPPVGIQIWNSDILWQPIPVHTIPITCDNILRISQRCDLLMKEQNQWKATIQKQLDGHGDLLAYLSKNTGLEVKTLEDISSINNNLEVVEEQGLMLPQWAQIIHSESFKSLVEIETMQLFKTPTMMKLQIGVLINEIVSNMIQKTKGEENFSRLLSLYSASDRILTRLWRGLNITREISRQYYGAALIIELHKINDRYRVKILCKKGTFDDKLSVLTIRGCENSSLSEPDEMCNLDTFSSVLQPMMITDFDEACQNPR